VQILWFGRPQGKQMPQSESCVPRRDLIRRHDRLTLPSARPAPYSSTLLAPRRDPIPSNTPIRSCRPLLVHAFADPAPHSPNSPNSPNSPKLVHAFVDPTPHSPNSPNSPNSPKPDLTPNFDATASSCRYEALADTGAAVNLISPTLVESLGLLLAPLPAVQPVILADGSSSAFQVRHHVRIRFCLPTLCRSWTISALVCRTGCRNDLGVTMDKGKLDYCRLGGSLSRQSRLFSSTAHAFTLFFCFRHTRFRCPRPITEGLTPIDAFPTANDPARLSRLSSSNRPARISCTRRCLKVRRRLAPQG